MPEISVIVPVYKVEEYLDECINSILNQSFKDYELILVDDGSPDRCGQICDEYAQKYNNIKVLHQKNKGLSAARNAGIEVAAGEFITFIDSDDIVKREILSVLYNLQNEFNADISVCSEFRFADGEDIKSPLESSDIYYYSGKDAVKALYDSRPETISITTWGKLYKRELFNNVRFPKTDILLSSLRMQTALIVIVTGD